MAGYKRHYSNSGYLFPYTVVITVAGLAIAGLLMSPLVSRPFSAQTPQSGHGDTPTSTALSQNQKVKNENPKIVSPKVKLSATALVIQNQPFHPVAPLLFGLGAQLQGAQNERLYHEAPLNMLTSWFSSPKDLDFMRGLKTSDIPTAYASGKSLHLIVWAGDEEIPITTKYGPACGRSYPFSSTFESDMKELATIYGGSGPLYVSMFTEFQTYPCKDNAWQDNENYFRALKDQYVIAQQIFKSIDPNAQVSLTWGGWQGSWDDKAKGGGASLLPHFADVMNTSDFQSFQAMDSKSNLQDIQTMTHLLHGYGSGANSKVMVAHYKPDNQSQNTWQSDLNSIFTPNIVASLQQDGLFAFSFMDEKNINASEDSYQQAKQIVQTYGL